MRLSGEMICAYAKKIYGFAYAKTKHSAMKTVYFPLTFVPIRFISCYSGQWKITSFPCGMRKTNKAN